MEEVFKVGMKLTIGEWRYVVTKSERTDDGISTTLRIDIPFDTIFEVVD